MVTQADSLPPAVFLMGPTASGKTGLAEYLIDKYPFEVISVDSALIYRDMNLGTAKPDADLLAKMPHHLIDICSPEDSYSSADFRRDALPIMHDIVARKRIPLLVGGTMLYFKVLNEGIAELPAADPDIRQRILDEAAAVGWEKMHEKLQQCDPKSAAKLHPNHSQRIQRALEVYYLTGQTLSWHQARQNPDPLPFNLIQLALWPVDRAELHARIATRFAQMLDQGFVQELTQLRQKYRLSVDLPSMRCVGYRQAWAYLEGQIDKEALFDQGVAATRQLAKRQMTWLRKWPDLHRLDVDYRKKNRKRPFFTSNEKNYTFVK